MSTRKSSRNLYDFTVFPETDSRHKKIRKTKCSKIELGVNVLELSHLCVTQSKEFLSRFGDELFEALNEYDSEDINVYILNIKSTVMLKTQRCIQKLAKHRRWGFLRK